VSDFNRIFDGFNRVQCDTHIAAVFEENCETLVRASELEPAARF
jgi:hypothetical protein